MKNLFFILILFCIPQLQASAYSRPGLLKLMQCKNWNCRAEYDSYMKQEQTAMLKQKKATVAASSPLNALQVRLSQQEIDAAHEKTLEHLQNELWKEWCPHVPCAFGH